jgi:HlyD family secretion protein
MKGWRVVAILWLCLVLASAACAGKQAEAEWQLVEVVRGDLTVIVSGSGNIGVSNEARLAFGSGGKVEKLYVEEGDKVSQGDVLAKLDTGALELALVQAKAALAQAEYSLNQLKEVSHASYDRVKVAELELEAAEQAVAQAQKQLDEATITAPFDGVVASVTVEEGDIIPSSTMSPQVIIHLVDLTTMELSAEVDEIDIPNVELGQRAIISVDALPGVQLEGEVTSVSPVATEESGLMLYKIKVGFEVPEGSGLKAGMSATADIVISERSGVLLVPSRAIGEDSQGNPLVKVMVGEQIEERAVVIGISDGSQTEIVSGLNEGDTVVIEKKASPGMGFGPGG